MIKGINLNVKRIPIGAYDLQIAAITLANNLTLVTHNTKEKITSLATGATNQIELSRATIASMRIPIAPLNEQKRIADKLDALLARVKVCRDRLEKIPRILEDFRQSVIAAAISRKLTEDLRANTQLLSIQNVFLEDVLIEIKTGHFGSTLHKADYVHGGIPVINPIHINNGKITESNDITVSEKKSR